jgi:hypothetical protein
MNKSYVWENTYFYVVLRGFTTSFFHLSLSNGYEFNVYFMITFSASCHVWNSYGAIYV